MATILVEGFDQYGPPQPNVSPQAALNTGGWGTLGILPECVLGPSLNGLSGYAAGLLGGSFNTLTTLVHALPGSIGRLIGGARVSSSLGANAGMIFYDNAVAQCSVVINGTSGVISANLGAGGTVIETSSSAIGQNTVHYIEWDITFGSGSSGSTAVWLDGVQIILKTGTNISDTNASVNTFGFFSIASESLIPFYFDDLYLFTASGTYVSAVLASNPMVVTQFPIQDYETNFANLGNVVGFPTGLLGPEAFTDTSANILWLQPIVPIVNCTAGTVYVYINGEEYAGNSQTKVRGVIYSDSSNTPNALLSNGTEVIGIITEQWLALPLTTPQALSLGTQYWIGFIINGPCEFQRYATGVAQGAIVGNTYTSGPPATAPTMTGGQSSFVMFVSCTGATTNYESEQLNPPIGDLSAVQASNVGTADLYVFPTLPALVEFVYTITVNGQVKADYAGYRTFNLNASSGGSGSSGSAGAIVPTTVYSNYETNFDTDPHTGGTWSVTSANAAYFGMSIAS